MKKMFAIAVLFLGGACCAPSVVPTSASGAPAPAAAASAAPAASTPAAVAAATTPSVTEPLTEPAPTTGQGQRELQVIVYFFSGTFELVPSKLLAAEFNQPTVVHVAPFWKDRTPGEYWLYLEFAHPGSERKPITQRIYRLREAADGQDQRIAVYRLPGNPADYAGEWHRAKPFEKLAVGDLEELPECRMRLSRNVIAFYVAGTMSTHCREKADSRVDHEHVEFKMSSSNFRILEQGFDASGRQVTGPPGPVEFRKISGNLL